MIFLSGAMLASIITWSDFKEPIITDPTPIGTYSNGCLQGGQKANLKHPYYQIIRQQNNRYYGDPSLLSYIENLAERAHQANLPILLVGDMSMPRGGPFNGGHASHQIGLDVDIWFRMVSKPLNKNELHTPWALNIVADNFLKVNKYYTPKIYTLIKLAAEDKNVERIFINAAIKDQLCKDTPIAERAWLHKIRPWWGHNAHLHVRLKCPSNVQECESSPPIPISNDGCGSEINSWIDDIRHPKPKANQETKPKPKPQKVLPKTCRDMIGAT